MSQNYAVLMAGGGGTRLWPLSRKSRPKQVLKLLGDRTMFQLSVERLRPLFALERILVVTHATYLEDLREQVPALPEENFILEPEPRGTAPAIGLAALAIRRRDPAGCMACLTADHYIGNEARFRDLLQAAGQAAQRDYLVTLGITPTFPSTGFGYIQRGASLGAFNGFEAFQARRFKEKPGRSEAEAMLADGQHAWNSGMFVWRADRILAEFARQLPDFYRQLLEIEAGPQALARVWPQVPLTTLDYGIMEGASPTDVALLSAEGLDWSDIGSWESLLEILSPDAAGNVVVGGEHLGLTTTRSLIHTSRQAGRQPRLIATIGISDLVIADTEDVLLVCSREHSQEVRQLVEHLKEQGQRQVYL